MKCGRNFLCLCFSGSAWSSPPIMYVKTITRFSWMNSTEGHITGYLDTFFTSTTSLRDKHKLCFILNGGIDTPHIVLAQLYLPVYFYCAEIYFSAHRWFELPNKVVIFRNLSEMALHSDVYCTELTPSRLANYTKVAILANLCTVQCKKRFAIFSSPAGMSLTDSPGWIVTSRLGTGKSLTFFTMYGE